MFSALGVSSFLSPPRVVGGAGTQIAVLGSGNLDPEIQAVQRAFRCQCSLIPTELLTGLKLSWYRLKASLRKLEWQGSFSRGYIGAGDGGDEEDRRAGGGGGVCAFLRAGHGVAPDSALDTAIGAAWRALKSGSSSPAFFAGAHKLRTKARNTGPLLGPLL